MKKQSNPSVTDADYWIAEWLGESNHRASAHTQRAYTADVTAFLAWLPCPFTQATAAQVLDWHSTLTGADASKARRLMAVRSFYTFLNAREITRIPVERLKGPRRIHQIDDDKVLSEAEVEAILKAAESDYETWLLIRFLYTTGARIGEVLGDADLKKPPARWRDFTPRESGASWVIRGKGRKKRTVFVPNPLWPEMCAHLCANGKASDNAPNTFSFMKVLIACEFSGTVRDAFTSLGHDAWSCDILETERPGNHIIGDVRDVLLCGWDLMIAHPPCTHLAVSGARWFKEKGKEQAEALQFVKDLMSADIPKIAIENPISIISSKIRKPDQVIQPWQFGHGETKATCLWLKNLPKLQPTQIVDGRDARIHKMPPSADRWKERSRTYAGIAKAFADQWGCL